MTETTESKTREQKTTTICAAISITTREKLEQIAARNEMKLSDVIRAACREYAERNA